MAAAIDVTGFILLYKRYEQKADTTESLPQSENKGEETTPKDAPQPSETLEETFV